MFEMTKIEFLCFVCVYSRICTSESDVMIITSSSDEVILTSVSVDNWRNSTSASELGGVSRFSSSVGDTAAEGGDEFSPGIYVTFLTSLSSLDDSWFLVP